MGFLEFVKENVVESGGVARFCLCTNPHSAKQIISSKETCRDGVQLLIRNGKLEGVTAALCCEIG